jgi:hypothetical protein
VESVPAKRAKFLYGIVILFLLMLTSARQAIFQQLLPLDYLIAFVLAGAVVLFCVADASSLNKNIYHSFRWIMFFTWPVAVPIYFVWVRGLKGLLYILLYAFLVCAVFYGTFVCVSLIIQQR